MELTTNLKKLRPWAIYVLGIFTGVVAVMVIGVLEYQLIGRPQLASDIANDPLTKFLREDVGRHEKQSGLRCADVHQGVRDSITKDLSPLLDTYKTAGDWKIDLDGKLQRTKRLSALAEACWSLHQNLVRLGSDVRSPITQVLMLQVSAAPVYVGNLASDSCGPACVTLVMSLIEGSRDALSKEIGEVGIGKRRAYAKGEEKGV